MRSTAFPSFLQLAVVGHPILIALQKEAVVGFPAPALAHPAGTDEHHVVGVTTVVLRHRPVLVDDVHEVRYLAVLVDHSAQDILRVGAVIGARSVEYRHQIARQMWDRHDPDIVGLVRRGAVDVPPGRNPGVPWAAVKERVPRVVGVVVRLRAFLPTRGDRGLDHRIPFFDVVDQFRVHVVGAGRSRQEAEDLLESSEDLVNDPALVFHGEEPDRQFLGREPLPELAALQAEERGADFIAVPGVMVLGDRHRLVIE